MAEDSGKYDFLIPDGYPENTAVMHVYEKAGFPAAVELKRDKIVIRLDIFSTGKAGRLTNRT